MDVIREHLMYKDVPITICMKDLTPAEHYEVIRILLASRTKDVSICTHESTNSYIDGLLKKLPLKFVQCFQEVERLVFSSGTGCSTGGDSSTGGS
jgi:hypothetical protein